MSDTIGIDKEEALQPAGRRKICIVFVLCAASLLLAIVAAALIMHTRPSPTERFRRDLLDAVEENNHQRFLDVLSFLQKSDSLYNFRNEEERKALQEAQALKLQIWLNENVTLWNDEELEKRSIVLTVLTSSSPEWGGSGLAESDEGFDLVERAIIKLDTKYPRQHHGRTFIRRDTDGKVVIGERTPSL